MSAAGLSSNRFEINKEAEFVSPKTLRGHQNPEERFLTHESEHEQHEHDPRTYTNPHLNKDPRTGLRNRESEHDGDNNSLTSGSARSLISSSSNYITLITSMTLSFALLLCL